MEDECMVDPTVLTSYLRQAYLPPLNLDESLPPVQYFAAAWPPIEELYMDQQRLIRRVLAIPILALQNAVRLYYTGFEKRLRVDWANTRLTLPCPGVTMLTKQGFAIQTIKCEMGFLGALEFFVLSTAAEAVRTIEKRQFDEDELKFVRLRVTSVRSTKRLWTVYSFGPQHAPTSPLRPGIAIIAIPPWLMGLGDMQEFSSRRVFAENELDREIPGNPPWTNAMKTWAMLYDSCRVSGYRWFVVTSYQYWIFGTWSAEWSGAQVTEPVPFDKTVGMTIVEMLAFWIECARGKCSWWRIAADAPQGS
ncbi:hypothetical protein PYCCODRAFT_1455819 [Trametes coccinea BRFM310]|uniref:Uncharacterized protein n=1 Tax=Trametes coccinea (strain BRFM310) TaxID=1353009 RepID=A0A1Y2J305_TRAC3|nr:hypothetical protein PYCCODRAFT_1455819 [Trametes coccinea BRFM310]